MDPERISDFIISDVVRSTAGRDQGELFYVIGTDPVYLFLANGKDRKLEKPKRKKRKHIQKVLRSETRVARRNRLQQGAQQRITKNSGGNTGAMQANNLGG